MKRTIIAAAILAAALSTGTAAASAAPAPFTPPPTACDASPFCFSYTTSGGLKLASRAGFGSEVQATTSATENGLNDSAWYASPGPSHVFQLFRSGGPTGLYLNATGGHLVLGHDASQAWSFDGVANPDGSFTGTWTAVGGPSAGLVWTATSNGGAVNLRAAVAGNGSQVWRTAKPTG
jgi:hypothetical protein